MPEETAEKHHEKPLEKLTVKELRELAAQIPHERAIHDMKKEELVAFIKETRGIKDDKPARKKAVKSTLTQPEIKARIRELKALCGESLAAKEGQKARDLRRQISRLKKRSRRAAAA